MRKFNIISRIVTLFVFGLATGCSPFREDVVADSLVEIEYSDPDLVKQNSVEPSHPVSGSLAFEIQQEVRTGVKTVFARAAFHEPVSKNVLFADVQTGTLNKKVYQPKPPSEDKPCGIPGFPDCPIGILKQTSFL